MEVIDINFLNLKTKLRVSGINIITRKEQHVGKIEDKLFKPIFKLKKIFFKRYRYYHCS